MSDNFAQLLARAQQGDSAAAYRILQPHVRTLIAYADQRIPQDLRRVVDAEDVVQDVCWEAFMRLANQTLTEATLPRWLLTIARNRLVTQVRRHRSLKRGGKAGPTSYAFSDDLMIKVLCESSDSPSRVAVKHEMHGIILSALGQLRKDHQTVLRLRFVDGHSVREAGQLMDRPVDAVDQLCRRALVALRNKVDFLFSSGS